VVARFSGQPLRARFAADELARSRRAPLRDPLAARRALPAPGAERAP
jgi:hypothetical protein